MKGLDLLASGAIPDTFLRISHGKNAMGYFCLIIILKIYPNIIDIFNLILALLSLD